MTKAINCKRILLFTVLFIVTVVFFFFITGFIFLLVRTNKPFVSYPEDETGYEFSTDWFSYNVKNWDKYKTFFKENSQCLEIGAFEGRSTLYIAQNFCNSKNSKTYVIDTWEWPIAGYTPKEQKDFFTVFEHNLKDYIRNKRVVPIKGESRKILPSLTYEILQNKLQKFDFVYIDGSHLAKDCMFDMILSWEMLKVNSIMIIDDYEWKRFKEPELTPKPAIDGFLASYKGNYEILHKGYQVHLKKIKE